MEQFLNQGIILDYQLLTGLILGLLQVEGIENELHYLNALLLFTGGCLALCLLTLLTLLLLDGWVVFVQA